MERLDNKFLSMQDSRSYYLKSENLSLGLMI